MCVCLCDQVSTSPKRITKTQPNKGCSGNSGQSQGSSYLILLKIICCFHEEYFKYVLSLLSLHQHGLHLPLSSASVSSLLFYLQISILGLIHIDTSLISINDISLISINSNTYLQNTYIHINKIIKRNKKESVNQF